jgi:multicomponent K+:H+ antiporter subunit E
MKSVTAPSRVPSLLVTALIVMWLLLSPAMSLAQLLLGTLLATLLAGASASLRPVARLRGLRHGIALAAVVIGDIARSNIGVARIVLGFTRGRPVNSGFVKIPLSLRDPYGLAVLAAIVTATPGTVWVDFDTASQTLTIHVLDLRDEQEWVVWIKNRYERRLLEIFR